MKSNLLILSLIPQLKIANALIYLRKKKRAGFYVNSLGSEFKLLEIYTGSIWVTEGNLKRLACCEAAKYILEPTDDLK